MADEEIKVAAAREIAPGKMKCVTVRGHRILIANVEGEFLAVDDMCTHEDWSLSKGCLKGDTVKCPLHGSRFNLRTGAPLEEPAEQPLKTYRVHVAGDDVFVRLRS